MQLESIVQDYRSRFQRAARAELAWYTAAPDAISAISRAALSSTKAGKRHPHQRRIPGAALALAESALLAAGPALCRARSFAELYETVARSLAAIRGVGELATYDIALRLGAFFRLEPEVVYLHAGTRAGARALGLDTRAPSLSLHELPSALRQLRPREIEDVLCIYKDHLGTCAVEVPASAGCSPRRLTSRCT